MPDLENTRPVPRRRSQRADAVAAAFEAGHLDYQYVFVEFLIDHFVDVGRAFKGDCQAMLVLAVLGQARLHAVRAAAGQDAGAQSPEAAVGSPNASRIADITGIPRQTVRRKLAMLADRGWIARDATGAYCLVSIDGEAAARPALPGEGRERVDHQFGVVLLRRAGL
ncbi:MAG TPA: hypothetical protein DEA05_08100 [Rhodobacteraceae bacterium]|nr:hypothetical protein [Paracoccaceae bacterium]